MTTRTIAILGLLIASAAGACAQQPRSIVGIWTQAGAACTRAAGALTIGPMSLSGEDVACRFSSVKREGNRVTWQGVCDDAEGSARQTVIATETEGRLTIRYVPGGNVIDRLVRCR
ncbi:MAG: hypothetical protein ACK4YX_02015 [Rhabdaerophilum calidifontis]